MHQSMARRIGGNNINCHHGAGLTRDRTVGGSWQSVRSAGASWYHQCPPTPALESPLRSPANMLRKTRQLAPTCGKDVSVGGGKWSSCHARNIVPKSDHVGRSSGIERPQVDVLLARTGRVRVSSVCLGSCGAVHDPSRGDRPCRSGGDKPLTKPAKVEPTPPTRAATEGSPRPVVEVEAIDVDPDTHGATVSRTAVISFLLHPRDQSKRANSGVKR
jgi:hypothetical protein